MKGMFNHIVRKHSSIKGAGLSLLLFLLPFLSYAQYDSYWLMSGFQALSFLPNGTLQEELLPPTLLYPSTQACITTANGNRFYSDNLNIYNKNWDLIQALPIDPTLIIGDPTMDARDIYSSLFLTTPDTNIYLFVTKRGAESNQFSQIFGTFWTRDVYLYIYKIDSRLNNNTGGVFDIDTLVFQTDTFAWSRLNAVRHANGKDWWIICHGSYNNTYHTFLYSDHFVQSDKQVIGKKMGARDDSRSNICFSLDGNKMAMYTLDGYVYFDPPSGNQYFQDTTKGYELFDFDRCTGKLSNYVYIDLKTNTVAKDWGRSTCAFSPNGENLYITTGFALFEYNIKSAQLYKVWDTIYGNFVLNSIKLAVDKKLYLTYQNMDTTHFMGIVEHPNAFGVSCGFQKAGYYLKNNYENFLPNTTNYNLGPVPLTENRKVYHDTICESEVYNKTLDSFPNSSYKWYKENALVNEGRQYSFSDYSSGTFFTIHIQDTLSSCSNRWDTLYLMVKTTPCHPQDSTLRVALPTAFTPNGDGVNDLFAPIFYQNTSAEMLMRIYNRWGEIVYNGNSAWDGKYKGVFQPSDTYFYVVDINGAYFKGNVELLK